MRNSPEMKHTRRRRNTLGEETYQERPFGLGTREGRGNSSYRPKTVLRAEQEGMAVNNDSEANPSALGLLFAEGVAGR